MANVMSLKNVRNKASRNGFDLSRRTCFTAKVGELLPVWWKYVLPGDSFTINLSAFTRTLPVNTASYGRVREYYDFFFVPLEQLWNKSHTVLTQMLDNNQHAYSLTQSSKLLENLPRLHSVEVFNTWAKTIGNGTNLFGFSRAAAAAKLMSYLGYSQINTDNKSLYAPSTPPNVSLYPLLAYQKIYSDFFRFTQWESPNPSTFNVDWMSGTSSDTLIGDGQVPTTDEMTFFDLRYCNYQKDLFHGIMPNAQFGETAAVPIGSAGDVGSLKVTKGSALSSVKENSTTTVVGTPDDVSFGNATGLDGNDLHYFPYVNGYQLSVKDVLQSSSFNSSPVVTDVSFLGGTVTSSSLSILALRQAEALQRWREVAQAAEEDYKQQIQAHWNVNVSDLLSGQSRYLGGINGNVNINEVVNTALVGGTSSDIIEYSASLAGKGIGSQNGNITFNSAGEYGVIMCVYHALPILDYVTTGTDASLLHVDASSFPIPEFDSIGMELLPNVALTNSINFGDADSNNISFLGYVPRYIDWKTDYDRCVGAFADTLQSWIIPYNDSHFMTLTGNDDRPDVSENPNVSTDELNYLFMKVNPRIVDVMFAVNADDTVNTDPLLCQSFFDVKVTRNLDVNGLPY